ncbi:hypothetical protein ISS30_06595 [bacterium]|nr:hypothetical protein [bacterium]
MFRSIAFIVIAILIFVANFSSVYSQAIKIDEVHLKNGSIIKGTITELYPDSLLKIETRDGNLFVFQMSEVLLIKKSEIQRKSLSSFDTNINIGKIGFLSSWGLTIFGAAAMGDEMLETTVIPVLGPFITMLRVEKDPEKDYLSGGKELLIISGTIQTFFFTYFAVSSVKKSKYMDQYGFYIAPDISKQGIQVGFKF